MEVLKKVSKQNTQVRQASLVAAALQLAAQGSPAKITTSDLAQAVGITQGAVFKHFANKAAIWLAVLDWTTDNLMTRLQSTAAAAPTPLAALQAVFLSHVAFVVSYPGVPRVIFHELQHAGDTALKDRVRILLQQYRQLLAGLLQRAQAQHEIAPDTDLQAASLLFIGSVQGLVMQSMSSGQVASMVQQAPGVFRIYLRGLGAMPPTSLSESQS